MTQSVYILGGIQTDFSRAWSREGLDISDMIRESCLGALEDCNLPASAIQVFQGMLLFFLLALDVLSNYRVRLNTPNRNKEAV